MRLTERTIRERNAVHADEISPIASVCRMQVAVELPPNMRADMLGATLCFRSRRHEYRPNSVSGPRHTSCCWGAMSDPRNVAHAKKVAQEKKHQGAEAGPEESPAVQPGKKPAAAKKKRDPAGAAVLHDNAPGESAGPGDSPAPKPSAVLEGSLVVLAKLKELEFHSRANLERLAELTLTVEDELKQKEIVSPLAEVYSAQSAFQTKLTTLIETYKAECDRMQGESAQPPVS
jgi:hypothetical protein